MDGYTPMIPGVSINTSLFINTNNPTHFTHPHHMEHNKPLAAAILIQTIYAAMFLLSKAAFDGGMNNFIFTFYRQAFATISLSPITFFFKWKTAPPLTFFTFCKIFLLSFVGIAVSLNLYGIALVYTSATLAAATTNCLPVITFFVALLLRLEVLRLKSIAGIAKLAGIVLCVGGVGVLAFYKGPQLKWFNNHHLFSAHNAATHAHSATASSTSSWLKGCFLMLSSNTLWGIWIVLQTFVLKSYPSKLVLTNLQCLLSSFQTFAIAIAMERDPKEWKLGWDVRLLSVAYCGVVVTAVTYCLQAWIIEKKGPVFLAMSTPFSLVITTVCSAILLGDNITLGSGLGGILLVGGLYFVLWGKSKEQKISEGLKEGGKECSMQQHKENTKLGDENSASPIENV
ncbi:WAT1-related protein At5g64700-like [Cucurbita moschata]|uniref:WAT1-related protein n=1 Tax=Cucurbita moschata TaxID=3662 RepID=A0A6J1G7I5_CUCMO|nr:WAT1-related protein At5g64700-like [Cucurbita moschata]